MTRSSTTRTSHPNNLAQPSGGQARRFRLAIAGSALVLAALAGPAPPPLVPAFAAQAASVDEAVLAAYRWRSIGPNRGGRSIAVSGVKGRPREAYFGAVGGGLWKTIDAGNNWAPVTDGQITSSSVGAVAVSESNPDIVFIGMGESCIRGNIMPGDGVYKSSDAGKTWAKVGFANVDAISKIRIHPTNPDIVYVAAFGQYYGPSEERGVFKSTDGGKTWRKTLYRDPRTGAVDLAIDANNPNVMFAALWEAYRIEYQMSSGGPGSGLFKSTDGGETWTEITRNPGLPSGLVGRIGVALTAADSNRAYALVENAAGGLFVSDDAGATWRLMNDSRAVRQRAFYYTHIHADPRQKDVVYMLNTALFRSTDGGKTIAQVGQGTHGDHHDLWIDPDDSEHVIDGNDGGGAVSFNISSPQRTWSDQDFPTAQWYHVVTTAHLPFHVCGAQQDNSTLCVPSDTGAGGFGRVPPVAPYPVGGGEPGYIAPDRTDPDIFMAGANNGTFLTRHNRRTGELKEVGAYPRFFSGEPSRDVKERWQWTYPIIFSYVDPEVLYTTSQRVWRSTDHGDSWVAISGDLSRADPKTFGESGGPITHDMNSPEIYGTVFSLAPGKKDINVLWAGSDDGLIHVTRDHGKTWTNVTPRDMPDFGRVSQIDGSSFDNGTAYVAVKKMLLGDRSPHIFRTRDYGKSWTKIVSGIADNDYVHTVREDPVRRGLLYAGTQHGAYISFDDGERWRPFKNGLPDTPVTDLVVEGNALAIGTHGRSFYVMDDIAALRQVGAPPPAGEVVLFKPADVIRGLERAGVSYFLPAQPKSLTIEFLDAKGQVMRTINGQPPPKPGEKPAAPGGGGGGGFGGPQGAPMAAGVNRYTWDLNSTPVVSFPGMILWGATQNGPMVLPGTYTVRLTADAVSRSQSFAIAKHPLRPTSDADLQYQWDLASRIRDKVNEANTAVIRIRRIKGDIAARTKDASKEVQDAGAKFAQALSGIEEEVYQVRNQSGQDPLNFPIRTNNRLASLLRVAVTGEGRPTSNVEVIFKDLIEELKGHTDRLDRAISTDLPSFNRMLERDKKEPISPK